MNHLNYVTVWESKCTKISVGKLKRRKLRNGEIWQGKQGTK